jgi:hypothetical protein
MQLASLGRIRPGEAEAATRREVPKRRNENVQRQLTTFFVNAEGLTTNNHLNRNEVQ